MPKKLRFTALALAVIMLLFAFAAVLLLFHEHSHNCTGEDCPVCAVISVCRDILKTILLGASVFSVLSSFSVFLRAIGRINRAIFITPVSLKVKMTN